MARTHTTTPRPEKAEEIADLRATLEKSHAVILTDFRGLTVAEINTLRAKLREAGAEYRVVKNRLMVIAGKSAGLPNLGAMLEGPTGAAFATGDPVTAAKAVQDFIRATRKLSVKGSVVSGVVYDEAKTKVLSELPSRKELLAKAVGSIASPLSGLVGVLSALPRNLVYALDQIRQKQEAA
jgi:large subunit ribosomal protein L10